MKPCELLSPAGDMDSAYAAIHYGADAIYLGLKKFSARADADNFTPGQVDEITAYAHSRSPRRKVFVTVNTLVRNHEMPELIESLAVISDIGVDAVIVQDLGVLHIARKYFLDLRLHASTQMAVHNLAGALAVRELGFRRVTLARELTLSEIRTIAQESGLEVEVFLHGALCYSYSGLCLYSSMLRGGSGNRGRCNYPCRDSFQTASGGKCFPFSMKDIALPDELPSLREAGVISFKIEGRKKSPLYVAATTAYYRKLIDGKPGAGERKQYEDDIKTIFSRPWTNLYIRSGNNRDTVDSETVGHRGASIGKVLGVINPNSRTPKLLFRTERAIERHDGLQIDLPGRPFGFPIDTLLLMPPDGKGNGKTVFEAPAGSTVQVILPPDHPILQKGSTIYSSSSQAVKRRYTFTRPKPGEFKVRRDIAVEVTVSKSAIKSSASFESSLANAGIQGTFERGRDIKAMELTARQAFEKLGDTPFRLENFSFNNPDRLFVPVSLLNRLRRNVLSNLKSKIDQHTVMTIAEHQSALKFKPSAHNQIGRDGAPSPSVGCAHKLNAMAPDGAVALPKGQPTPKWSIKTDSISNLSGFSESEWNDIEEVVVDIGLDPLAVLSKELKSLSQTAGMEKIRLSLPIITRSRDEQQLLKKINKLSAEGWNRWEATNISAWSFLSSAYNPCSSVLIRGFSSSDPVLTSDFSLYILNRAAALQAMEMGVSRFTLSPEDSFKNMSSLLEEFGEKTTVIVYQDTPLFISETCGLANISGKCAGRKSCNDTELPLVSGKKEQVILVTSDCRTIVINEQPYCLAAHIGKLISAGASRFRADFIYRRYTPARVLEIWRSLRSNRSIPSMYSASFYSGI